MLKINLVPELQETKQKQSRVNYLTTVIALSVVGFIVLVLIIISGISVANNAQKKDVEAQIKTIETELSQYKGLEETVLSIQAGLKEAKDALDGKNSWTKLLVHLESATPKDVKFVTLTVEPNKIVASLEGKDINSVARFADSYKQYGVLAISGKNEESKKVFITIDNGSETEITVKENGTWIYAAATNLTVDHDIKIRNDGGANTAKYIASSKTVTSESGDIAGSAKYLFTNVSVSQYKKEGAVITFEATMGFDGELIW